MGYSISQDMEKVNSGEGWDNHGRRILEDSCGHTGYDKSEKPENKSTNVIYSGYCENCDISEDSAIPIMNYIYPLELKNFEDSKILKVVKETNCTIIENTETGEWFLTLCGGGMDLSQDIAFAFQILETWIPQDLLGSVCKQANFSLGSKNYKSLARGIIKQIKMEANRHKQNAKEWKESLKNLREKEKAKEE